MRLEEKSEAKSKNLDGSYVLSEWMMVFLFRRGNVTGNEGLGRTREGRVRGNEFNCGHFELDVSVRYK